MYIFLKLKGCLASFSSHNSYYKNEEVNCFQIILLNLMFYMRDITNSETVLRVCLCGFKKKFLTLLSFPFTGMERLYQPRPS